MPRREGLQQGTAGPRSTKARGGRPAAPREKSGRASGRVRGGPLSPPEGGGATDRSRGKCGNRAEPATPGGEGSRAAGASGGPKRTTRRPRAQRSGSDSARGAERAEAAHGRTGAATRGGSDGRSEQRAEAERSEATRSEAAATAEHTEQRPPATEERRANERGGRARRTAAAPRRAREVRGKPAEKHRGARGVAPQSERPEGARSELPSEWGGEGLRHSPPPRRSLFTDQQRACRTVSKYGKGTLDSVKRPCYTGCRCQYYQYRHRDNAR